MEPPLSRRPPHLLLVDGLNLVRRVYAGMPDSGDAEGVIEAIEGSFSRALREASPTHAVAVFDGSGPTWRHHLLPSYKADRPAMPEDLAALLPDLSRHIKELGIAYLSVAGYEADDIIASLAARAAAHRVSVTILSTDKGFLQLVGGTISVRNHFERRGLDADYVRQRFDVTVGQFVDYLALVGDKSLGITGVPGIGAKGAAELLREHTNLDTALEVCEERTGRSAKALARGREQAILARELMRARTDLELGLNLKAFRLAGHR